MKVSVEDAGPCRKLLQVNASPDAVIPEYDAVVKEFAKSARIPGFRAGKAPVNVVERHYAKGITQRIKDRLVPRLYHEALDQEKIAPVAIVDIHEIVLNKERSLSFKVTIDIAPKFKLPRYRKIPMKREKIQVDDKQVGEALDRLLANSARFEDVTGRSVRPHDLVLIDYHGECESKPVAELAPDYHGLGEGKDFWAAAAEPEFLPGFAGELEGASIGEDREIKVHFPEDYRIRSLADKTALYRVLVKGIRERILPDLDETFLKRFEVDSESALREKIRCDLLDAAENNEKERLKGEIGKCLLEKTSFEVPRSIVEQETGLTVRNIVHRMQNGGGTKEEIEKRKDSIVNAATQSSTDRVKLSYILNSIAIREKFQVDESEVDKQIESMAGRYGVSPAKLKAEIENKNGIEKLKSDVLAEKTLTFLLKCAKIKE